MAFFPRRQFGSGFRIHHIRKRPIKPFKPKRPPLLKKSEFQHLLFLGLIILVGVALIIRGLSALNLSSWFSILSGTVGKELEIDEKGRTNILLLGMAGKGNEGEELTDSIMMISYHHRENKVTLFSIPRDIYIETKETGGNRINRLYELGKAKFGDEETGLEYARYTISQLLDVPLHYVWRLDFKGFEKLVDALDGITINVPETIDDPLYPKDGTYNYERFFLAAGMQKLDGKTTLKYVRSRQTSSDFLRSARQQEVLLAIKNQAIEQGILLSPSRLKALYRTLREHTESNMDLREMITLAKVATRVDESRVYHFTIHDDPTVKGGFLYTPLRELYGGAFVLLPASDTWNEVKRYTRLITEKPEWLQGNLKVHVVNGTRTPGLAGSMKVIFKRYGLAVPRFGNARAQGLPVTTLYIKNPTVEGALSIFENLFPVTVSKEPPEKYLQPPYQSDTDVIVELGEDFLEVFDTLDVFRNVVELKPTFPSSASSALPPSSASASPAAANTP